MAKSKEVTDERMDGKEVKEARETKLERRERRDKGRDRSREVARKSARSENPLIRYFQETGVELRKVTWPTRETTIRLSLIVLGTTAAFAIFLGALDFLFQRLAALLVRA